MDTKILAAHFPPTFVNMADQTVAGPLSRHFAGMHLAKGGHGAS